MEFVTERIAVGHSSDAMNERGMIHSDIKAALNVADDLSVEPYEFIMCKHEGLVCGPGNTIMNVEKAVTAATMLLTVHQKILIFCHSGQDRSPLVAAAVIAETEKITFDRAWRLVIDKLKDTEIPVTFSDPEAETALINIVKAWSKQLGCGQHLVSCIVPCVGGDENKRKMTENCLISIRDCTIYTPIEVIAINDGTPKDKELMDILSMYSDEVIVHDENMGAAKSRFDGNEKANGDIICQMDNDTVVFPNWLLTLVGTLMKSEDNAIVAPLFTCDMGYFARDVRAMDYSGCFQVEQVGTACMLYQKELLDVIGNFDPELYNLWEDKDFCYRLTKKKLKDGTVISRPREESPNGERYRIVKDPKVTVYHPGFVDPATGDWESNEDNTRSMDHLQDEPRIAKSMELILERWGEKHGEYDYYCGKDK